MAIYIIGDIHLSQDKENILNSFIGFTKTLMPKDSLYILGDLFEYFIGVDPSNRLHITLKQLFSKLRNNNIDCYFQHGNRDFLLNMSDAKFFSLNLISDTHFISHNNNKILLIHGDELCCETIQYQIFRTISRISCLQKLFSILVPLKTKISIAEHMREKSKLNFKKQNFRKKTTSNTITLNLSQKKQVNMIIHGHTHNAEKKVINDVISYDIGDWRINQYSYLKITTSDIQLITVN